MDENKIPEQESNWLDEVLGPEATDTALGPDESALLNEYLTDPGAPTKESFEMPEEIPEVPGEIPETCAEMHEIPADLPDTNSLAEIDDKDAESTVDMSSTQLLMDAVDALIADEPACQDDAEEAPQE